MTSRWSARSIVNRDIKSHIMASLTALNFLIAFVVNGCSAARHSDAADPARFSRAATTSGVRPQPPQPGTGLGPIVYRINEDCEPGTIVGDLRRDGDLDQRIPGANRAVIDQLRFNVLLARDDGVTAGGGGTVRPQANEDDDNPNRHFSLDPISGIIRAVTTLDRDRICPESETCVLGINVAVQPAKYFRIIRVVFDLIDENDNSPRFPTERLQLHITEGTAPGSTVDLRPATDPDSPANGITSYHIVDTGSNVCRGDQDQSDAVPFGLRVDRSDFDGSFDVRLIVLPVGLDRERCDTYRLAVVARDAGRPQRSGTMIVEIAVNDVDDNRPVFEFPVYEAEVVENVVPSTSVKRPLVTVRAHDADVGRHALFVYQLSPRSAAAYGNTFAVHRTSGEVTQLRPVDYERLVPSTTAAGVGSGTIVLEILAVPDKNGGGSGNGNAGGGGDGSSLPVMTTVRVKVRDVNDNAPEVTIESASSTEDHENNDDEEDGEYQSESRLTVTENCENGTFIAQISVHDQDSGQNGEVECHLLNGDGTRVTNLHLYSIYENEYHLMTSGTVDREQTAVLSVQVVCRDRGQPSLKTVRNVVIDVNDVNDNSPRFTQSMYNVFIAENQRPSEILVTVSANDIDLNDNAKVWYQLQPEIADVFTIDSTSGSIRSKQSLDREIQDLYTFYVIAVDRADSTMATGSLSSTAQINIRVIDKNDEPPRFSSNNYFLSVSENQPSGTSVGRLSARDADLPPNDRFRYQLQTDSVNATTTTSVTGIGSRLSGSRFPFRIDNETGIIRTTRALDRETVDRYLLSATVSDTSNSSIHDVTSVHIYVTDENDNAPVVLFPDPLSNNTVQLSSAFAATVGHVIGVIEASDSDLGVNSRLLFSMSDKDDLFDVDRQMGEVRIKRALPDRGEITPVTYLVQVAVSDGGSPKRSSTAKLFVVVSPTGLHPGPRPALATSLPSDVVFRRDAVGYGTDLAASRLELLPLGEWKWPGVIVGCVAVAVVTLAVFVIVISGCAARQRRRRKEKLRHRSGDSTAVNGAGRPDGAGFRASVAMETLERKRTNAGGSAMDVSTFGGTEPEEEEGEPRSPGSRSSRQRQQFDVGGDLTTFISSSPTPIHLATLTTGSDRSSKVILSLGNEQFEICDGCVRTQLADRPNVTIPRLHSTQLYGNLSPATGPVTCSAEWLLAAGRSATSPPPSVNRMTSFSSWLTTPPCASVDESPESLPLPLPLSPGGVGWRPSTTTHTTTSSTSSPYRRIAPNAIVGFSPSRATTANLLHQQFPPPTVDSLAYYTFDTNQSTSGGSTSGVYVSQRHNGDDGLMSNGGHGINAPDRLRQQQTGRGRDDDGMASTDWNSCTPATSGPCNAPYEGAPVGQHSSIGYGQVLYQQQSPLMQAMYGSLRRGVGRQPPGGTIVTMSSSSSSLSLPHHDLQQEVSA